jgi:chromosome segregation ATPase
MISNILLNSYKKKTQRLEADLELREKVDIHELEERKNLHINQLIYTFDEKLDRWKKENIEQIKDNITLIKTNREYIENLKSSNKGLEKELDELGKKKSVVDVQLEEAKRHNSVINNRLAKYYNQDTNIVHVNAKIKSLKKKCNETQEKTNEIEKNKNQLIIEIRELRNKFKEAILKYKDRAEYKNSQLDQHILQLKKNYDVRELEIEKILEEVDRIASNDSDFSRKVITDMLDNIRNVLSNKTQIIKNLKYSLALATKVDINNIGI